jgi:hypothetical protein
VTVRIYTLTISNEDAAVTGLEPGTYCTHVSDESLTIMFRPVGERTFRLAKPMEEEK